MFHFKDGSTRVLELMRRGYTRETYLKLIHRMRETIPNVYLTTDVIAGFCGETEEDHKDTVAMMNEVGLHFKYCRSTA